MLKLAHLLLVPVLTLPPLVAQDDVGAVTPAAPKIMLHYGAFDPLGGAPVVPPGYSADDGTSLYIVQFHTEVTQAHRDSLATLGAHACWYAPHQAYVVRMDAGRRNQVAALPAVRWVGAFQPAYKLQPSLMRRLVTDEVVGTNRYVIVMVEPRIDEAGLVAAVERVGGAMWRYAGGNLLIEADLTAPMVTALAHEDTVLWIQEATEISVDMDQARIQGGANYIESQGGYTGKGVRGHIMEGIYPTHPEFAATTYRTVPPSVFSGSPTTHGNSTFGEVFAGGVVVRGMLPDGQGMFTDYNYIYSSPAMSTATNSRYGVVRAITDPALQWKAMFQTASWGYAQITNYDARSAEMDWIIHQFDIPICQSQSNTSNRNSRPQAWAKNMISVGALNHLNTANPNDDTQSGTSMGPASDNRIKPDMCAYYDQINTTNGSTTYTSSFGGTSGATPMVVGHLGLILELFTDGLFGHPAAPSWTNRFDYKPHFSTAKALLINTARQYDPAINGAGATSRYRQGWGFPALQDVYDLRDRMLVLDEVDVLTQGQTRSYWVHVKPNTPKFKTTMVYSDLAAAAPFSSPHRVNDLSLKVTSPGGVAYHGNNGLGNNASGVVGLVSTPGGAPNTVDTVENVFLRLPPHGIWQVDVSAPLIAMDQHVETGATDADFALVSSGIGGGRDRSGAVLDLASTAPGNLSISLTNNPAGYTEGYVLYSFSTSLPFAMGNFLGLELDGLALASLALPAAVGSPFHFSATSNPSVFPNAPFNFPASVALALSGLTLDAVAFYFDATGSVPAASNVDRVTVQ
ncbi:MAG: S8 family serine peptidase [Planctomycetota bacterium]